VRDDNVEYIAGRLEAIHRAPDKRHVVFEVDRVRGYYVQFLSPAGATHLYGELVSNRNLPTKSALDDEQVSQLLARGWELGAGNFKRYWEIASNDAFKAIAEEVLSALEETYGVDTESPLEGSGLPLPNIDADLANADWIKTLAWDLPTEKDAFLAAIGGESQLAKFMTLPAARAMPPELAAELGIDANE